MNLIWHIVKKDLRALKWPLLLWTLLIVAKLGVAVLLLTAHGTEGPAWFLRMDAAAKILTGLGFISFVLVAALIQQDLLVGTTAFWMTRPISGARLLGAKLLGIGLIFGVLPVVLTLPWWLGCGLSLRDMGWAAAETVGLQFVVVMLGLLWAVVTDGLARFLLWTLVLVFAIVTGVASIAAYLQRAGATFPSPDLLWTRIALVMVIAAVAIAAVAVHQFTTRRTARSVGGIAAAATLTVVIGLWWPWSWELKSRYDEMISQDDFGSGPARREPPGLQYSLGQAWLMSPGQKSSPYRAATIEMEMKVAGLPPSQFLLAQYADHLWRWPDGTVQRGRSFVHFADVDGEMIRQGLGAAGEPRDVTPAPEKTMLTVAVSPGMAARMQAEAPSYRLRLRSWVVKYQSTDPVPLQPGPSGAGGLAGERIAAIEKEGEELVVTFVRHYPALLADDLFGDRPPLAEWVNYVLLSRDRSYLNRGGIRDAFRTKVAGVEIDWRTMAYRASAKGGGPRPLLEAINALNDAELLKITYTQQAYFNHEIDVDHFTLDVPQATAPR
jgi:hypothetical protein